jgi:hypothetical protein
MKTKYIPLGILVLLCSLPLSLAGGEPGSSGATFLKLGVDGRAIGMGEAHTAMTDNVNGLYWNPAGIAELRAPQFSFMHNFYFLDMHHDYLGFATPMGDRGSVGLSVTYWTSGPIMGMDEYGMPTSEFSAWDLATGFYYAHRFNEYLFTGGGVKAVVEKNEEEGGAAIATDVGIIFKPSETDLRFGITIQNLGSDLQLVQESYPLPLTLRLGSSWKGLEDRLMIAGDFSIPNDDEVSLSIGAEYKIYPSFAIRSGYKTGSDLGAFSGMRAGLGFEFQKICVDYAVAPYGELGNSHRVSLLFKL